MKARTWPWFAGLFAVNLVYRVPALLHAHDVNSDSAVVGLQAMHFLKGETARLLWGATYQGTIEPALAAALFAVGGPTPLMLALTSLLIHLVVVLLGWRVLLRRLDPAKAFGLSLFFVFTPQVVNNMISLPQLRIACFALVFAGVLLIDLATPVALAAGAFTGMLGIYADVYGMQLMAPVLIFACLCVSSRRHAAALAVGLGLGITAVVFLRTGTRVFAGPGGLGFANLGRNWGLLVDHGLPMILGAQVWDPELWTPPAPWRVWQVIGGAALVLGIASAGPLALVKRLSWEQRRLGLLGAGVGLANLLGFLVSSMPGDNWAARYLAGFIMFAPFALVPLAGLFTLRGLLLAVLVPYLSVAAVSGLRAWGWSRLAPAPAVYPEDELQAFLRARDIRYAGAAYWLSYRLTFLFREEPIVAPLEGAQRYAPYREAFEQEPRVAYITHPSVPDLTPEMLLERFSREPGTTVEPATVAGYSVFLVTRSR